MSVYGEFDDRFRPRPPAGRLAILSVCQFVIAVWVANALVSTADMLVWRMAKVERAWIVYLPPWTTLKAEAARHIAPLAQHEYERLTPTITGALVFLGVLLFFWPWRQTAGGRLFSIRLAQCVAAFGGAFALRHKADLSPPVLITLAVAACVVIAGEWSTNAVLAQVIDLRRPVSRLGQWFVRVVPGAIAVAATAYFAAERIVLYVAVIFAALAFLANVIRAPAARYERIEKPGMGGAVAAALLVAALILGGCGWLFGFLPLRAPHVVVITAHRVRIETWNRFVRELPTMFPAFDIHWTTPKERGTRKQLP